MHWQRVKYDEMYVHVCVACRDLDWWYHHTEYIQYWCEQTQVFWSAASHSEACSVVTPPGRVTNAQKLEASAKNKMIFLLRVLSRHEPQLDDYEQHSQVSHCMDKEEHWRILRWNYVTHVLSKLTVHLYVFCMSMYFVVSKLTSLCLCFCRFWADQWCCCPLSLHCW